jgi:hypothetical protein
MHPYLHPSTRTHLPENMAASMEPSAANRVALCREQRCGACSVSGMPVDVSTWCSCFGEVHNDGGAGLSPLGGEELPAAVEPNDVVIRHHSLHHLFWTD